MAKKKLSDFVPQSKNANKHTERGMGMLDKSISKDGWLGAITVAADGETFDGSARLETAYTRFGDEVEPIVVETDGSRPVIVKRTDIPSAEDPRAKRLAIAANRIAEIDLEWDAEVLAELSQDEDIELGEFWFDDELTDLLEDLDIEDDIEYDSETDEETTADLLERAESGQIESRVKLGEIWQLGRHYIACGDSTDEGNVRKLLGDKFGDVGMVWADPPYGLRVNISWGFGDGVKWGKSKTHRGVFDPVINDDKPYDPSSLLAMFYKTIILWGANYYADRLPSSPSWIVWDKSDGLVINDQSDAELAWVSKGNTTRVFRHLWKGMIKASEQGQKRVHPTQKPIALCEWAFEKYGKPDDVIFDPFLGSAPSIIAAQKMEGNRTVYGFELSPEYCTIILERFQNFTGKPAKLVGHL